MNKSKIVMCLLIAFLMFSFCCIAIVRADDLIPMPTVTTERKNTGYGEAYGMMIQQQQSVGEAFGIGKDNDTENGNFVMIQGNINSNESGDIYDFQYQLLSYENFSGISFNCSGETIPAIFLNCGFYNMTTTNVTRDSNNVPIWNNTITINDIPMNTYGHGNSTFNLNLTQHFHADWTVLTIKTDVSVDLTNLKLYTNDGNEVPQGTDFALNFNYLIDVMKMPTTPNGTQEPIHPSQITSTEIDFPIAGNHSIADMSLNDNYTEIQHTTEIPNKITQSFFSGEGIFIQMFNGLTYGETIGVQSDPTIRVQHSRLSTTQETPTQEGTSTFPILPVAIGITIGAVVTVVAVRYIKKPKTK